MDMTFNFDGMLLKAVVHNNDQPRLLASRQRTTPYCATPKNCPTVRVMKRHHELAPAAASHHMSSQLSGTSSALASDQSMRLRRAYPKKLNACRLGLTPCYPRHQLARALEVFSPCEVLAC